MTNQSYFTQKSNGTYAKRASLEGRLDADILIVGAGMTGLSTAYELSKRIDPSRIKLIDSGRVGFSTTGLSSGLLCDSVEEDYCDTKPEVFREIQRGVEGIVKATQEHGLKCDLRKIPSMYIATDKEQVSGIQEEFQARQEGGYDVQMLDRGTVARDFGVNAEAAMKNNQGYCLDPLKFCQELARVLEAKGVRIFEGTKLTKYDPRTKQAQTEHGNIQYNKLVLINASPTLESNPMKSRSMLLSTAVAVTEPIPDEQYRQIFGNGEYMGWDASELSYAYFRPVGDNRVLIGGSDRLASVAETRNPQKQEGKIQTDRKNVRELFETTFPGLKDVKFDSEWSGVIPTSVDSLSFVGEYRQDHYVGLYGAGLPVSFRGGELLAGQICGEINDSSRLFDCKRKVPIKNRVRGLAKYNPFTAIANWLYF